MDTNIFENVRIHPTAEVSPKAIIGSGTSVWNNVQIRENCKIGYNCVLSKDVYIDFDVIIGDRVKLQNGISVYHGVVIEDDVFLGPHMVFTNDLFPRAFIGDFVLSKTLIKKGASVGANATIICGNTINEYAMIGSGSVVTKDVPKYGLVVGNPAKLIGFVGKSGRRLSFVKEEETHILMKSDFENESYQIDKEDYKQILKK